MMLELHKVSRAFGGLQAVMQVDITVPENKIVGLIGPNGAGKTTLINCISGLDHPTEGVIRFRNTEIQHTPAYRITALGLARTYQNIRLLGQMTVLENLIVAQHHHGNSTLLHSLLQLPSHRREERQQHERALALLERFHLLDVQDAPAGSLPYGDQRRLEMARALATRPRMLLLDEPTAGMNPAETRTFGEQILKVRDEGLTLLVIEHDMSLIAQICDEVYVLNFGQVIAHGTLQEIHRNDAVIEAYLGKKD
jgi:branched-chain amino acid transport system ATP-binding protein